MKKIFLLLLLIPFSIQAKGIEASIECSNTLKINAKINCDLYISNDYASNIKNIEFDKNELLLDLKSDFEMNNDEKTIIEIESNESKIKVLNFNYLMSQNDINIYLKNVIINTNHNNYVNNELIKNLKIDRIAYVDNILINNQPIPEFNKDTFNYEINLYDKSDYVELRVLTSNGNNVDSKVKLIKSFNNPITFDVYNEYDRETYSLKFNFKDQNENEDIKINEMSLNFDKNKKYYYLEVNENISKLTINNNIYELNDISNKIKVKNNTDIYLFEINKIKNNEIINTDKTIKSLKIGNSFLNLREDNYEYYYDTLDIVEVETTKSKDYEIKYNSDNILITIYDSNLDSLTYKINITTNSDNETKEFKEYDKTKTMLIFFIFLLMFILITLAFIRKNKRERIYY